MKRDHIRNIAIIAHVDHGKTTLVDEMLKQSGVFRANQTVQERVMDSNDLERERGITILSKNTAVHYQDVLINVVDTPGHADFGGEVERVLKMVDGVLLLVDAFEGPMPQTRFVLERALALSHPVVVVVNKIDRPDARPREVVDEVLELFLELEADDSQFDSPFVFASARQGVASLDPDVPGTDLKPLFDTILTHIPAPEGDETGPLQLLISTIDYNDYVGRIGIGRIERGSANAGQEIGVCNMLHEETRRMRLSGLYSFEGLGRVPIEAATVGEIVAVVGIPDIHIGDTLCAPDAMEPLPFVRISEPTVSMTFSVNNSPFAGREGQYVTSRHLRERLMKELDTDVSLRVEETDSPDAFLVSGRGELHLSVLIETMRRQGYEMQVSRPKAIMREMDGQLCEPLERVVIDVPETSVGVVIEKLGSRKGEMVTMHGGRGNMTRLEFIVPSRGLFGYRSEFLTDTRGEGIMNTLFEGYAPYKGDMGEASRGALIASEDGTTTSYGLFNAQDRGPLNLGPGEKVYKGMIVGRNSRTGDIEVNVCKQKHLTSIRNQGSAEEALRLTPPHRPTLEEAIEWVEDDELLEVTPKSLRLRKKILDGTERYRAARK